MGKLSFRTIGLLLLFAVSFVAVVSCNKHKKDTTTLSEEDSVEDNQETVRKIIRYGQYNIEFANDKPESIPWSERRKLVKQVFDKYDFDIITIDEARYPQLEDMLNMMPEYEYYGSTVKGDANTKNITVGMMYKSDRFKIEKSGRFWLSATPFILSKAYGGYGNKNRICNWAFLKDKKLGDKFYVFATHIETRGTGEKNQWKQVSVVLNQIKSMSDGYPTFLSGDFNFTQNSTNYDKIISGNLLEDSYNVAQVNLTPNQGTYNGYDVSHHSKNRIDHIFLTKCNHFKVKSYQVLAKSFSGKFPSDHFPVLIKVIIPGKCK